MNDSDRLKLAFEFFKHLSLLNTASIGLMASLAERVLTKVHPDDLAVVFIWFGLSLVGSLFSMAVMVLPHGTTPEPAPTNPWKKPITYFQLAMLFLAGATFSLGILTGAYVVMGNSLRIRGLIP
ncbi:MAG: hypothetical protein K8T91_05835 [Planctomycetes bacterium]|nr:hypothetical protein [Planctomycetota bacterium]